MKVEITTDKLASYRAGQRVELPAPEARTLLARGDAIPVAISNHSRAEKRGH